MMKNLFVLQCFLLPLVALAQTFTVKTVPDPRQANNSHVSNPSSLLRQTTVDSINSILNDLEIKTTAQVAVVVLASIGDADGFDFAQELFTKWGIGRAKNDNGLLILFIEDQHYIRFHTGLALEGILTDARCKQIQQSYMVPYFKEGNIDDGMLKGIYETAQFLLDPTTAEEITDTENDFNGVAFFYMFISIFYFVGMLIGLVFELIMDKFSTKPSAEPKLKMSWMLWLSIYLLIPGSFLLYAFVTDLPILQFLLFAGMFILFVFAEKFTRTIRQIAQYDGPSVYYLLTHEIMVWKIESFVFPFPALIGFLFFTKKKNDIRFGPRDCNNCSAPLIRQTEKTEDRYMKPGQIQEEKIGVTDYDVWHCNKCQASEIISYPDFSKRHEYKTSLVPIHHISKHYKSYIKKANVRK
jgi:uncharacterized protein